MRLTKTEIKNLTYQIIGAAIEVHKALGPGLYEKVYLQCLIHELKIRNLKFKTEMKIPFIYKNCEFETDFRCDIIVEDNIVIELKSVDKIIPIHEAQLLTYLKLLQVPKGIILNFNCSNLYAEGQKTFVTMHYEWLDE